MTSAVRVVAALAAVLLCSAGAQAQTKLRVGKAQANQFAFVPADIGVDAGIFKKHGLDIEISAFGGDARMMQALTADGVDIALGGGPAIATIVKGTPMKAVAALANEPNTIMLVVAKDGPIKSVADLKDKAVSVSTAGSLTYWLTMQLSQSQGWGPNGIKITPLGASNAQIAALKTNQVAGVTTDSVTVYKFMEEGGGRILVKFGERVKDFHVHIIYASDKLMKENPKALRDFLAAWFETIAFMKGFVERGLGKAGIRIIATGDLTDCGLPEEYKALRDILSPLSMPVYLVPGNHDRRAEMRAEFSRDGYLTGNDGFLHYVVEGHPLRLIGLDTVVPGAGHGEMDAARLSWLERRLGEKPDAPTMIFMPPPPFRTGLIDMDNINCRGGEAMAAVVKRFPNVQRVVCGHHHRPVTTRWAGTIGSVSPSTALMTEWPAFSRESWSTRTTSATRAASTPARSR
mgnify:CR=1 FL=1